MEYIVRENVKDIKEFNYLYDNVGWGSYDDNISKIALDNTLYSVSIYDNDDIIGYGRVIGDMACFIYIQDIMVKKDYQACGIGTKIMELLLDKINDYRKINNNIRVYLGASKDREGFYKKFGFVTRSEACLGEGMILDNNKRSD